MLQLDLLKRFPQNFDSVYPVAARGENRREAAKFHLWLNIQDCRPAPSCLLWRFQSLQ